MDCPDNEAVERYVLHQLDRADAIVMDSHLQECESCQRRIAEARENEKFLAQLKTRSMDGAEAAVETGVVYMTIEHAQEHLGERYRVIRRVGEGASGQVFQAIDTALERLVAVKFLESKWLPSDSSAEVWAEAKLMSQLNHPSVAQIYEVKRSGDWQLLIMEWVDGVPIAEAWRDLPLGQRLRMYLDVLDAVAAAHRQGIVHRDLKPSNILVTSNQKPKILDFGIALDLSAWRRVSERIYRGTPAYSAPEQIARPTEISPATDVFALGVLLYELLTDILPFPQSSVDDLLDAILTQHPQLPNEVEEKVPVPLQNICLKALEKETSKRYADAWALAQDVKRHLRGERVWSRASFLADRIQQEVFYHRQKLRVWRDNELVTETEYDRLERIYQRLVAPPDPSIIEARRLSLPQVCLYLGGWICVLGSFVLLYEVWDGIPTYLRPAPALLCSLVIMILGVLFWNRRESRLSVGFLATSSLLIPMALLLLFGHLRIFHPADISWGVESVYQSLEGEGLEVGNVQLFICAVIWLSVALGLLRLTRSSIFVVLGVVAFLSLLTVVYVVLGMIDEPGWDPDVIAGRYLFPGIGFFVLAIVLDRREFTHYAAPLSVAGLILIVGPLSIIAGSDNTWFGWLRLEPTFLEEQEKVPLGFVANGMIYLLLATLCRAMGTVLQRRLAQVLNWLGPLHILGALRQLDDDELGLNERHLLFYRFLLPLVSLAFVFGSVARQMKSFFFSGLTGITVAVHRFTERGLRDYFAWPVSLVILGTFCMLLSWAVPRWRARAALRQEQ